MLIHTEINSFPNFDAKDVSKITINNPEMSYTVSRNEGGQWMLNDIAADSAMIFAYLGKVSRLNSNNFVDDVIPSSASSHSLQIEGNNFNPIEIKAFPADTTNKYLISSSINPETYFSGAKASLFEKAFVGPEAFLKVEE